MKKHLFLIVLLLIGCGKKTSSSSFDSSSFLESTSSSSFDVNALLDDPDADGQYGNGVNENRFPDDDLYETVQERKRILNVGETYLETFENDYLETKLYPDYVDAQATVQILETGNCHIAGKSVCLTTPGNYYGTRFSGMKFARNGSYHIEFDYKIVVASNDFFFQFRSMAGGIATDIYKVIQGSAGSSGHLTFEVTFDDYSDYALSIFPRNNAGKLAIDNISITRLNSVPRVLGGSVVGTLSVGHTLTYSYNYYDSEGDVEALSEITWFTALNKNGLNKTVISEAGTSLLVTSDMVGKYVGFSVVPISVGTSQTKGKSYLFYSDTRIDSLGIEIPSNIYLDYGETFEEDFEEDLNVVGNIYAEENEAGATTYLIDDSNVLSGSKSLYFESKGSYSGIVFSGIKFANLGLYKLEYDFKFLEKSGNYYVQFRTNAGYSYDKFTDISMTTYTLGTQYHYSNTFALDNFNDYYLMMFPSTNPTKIIIDNIKITRLEGDNVIINDVELDIGQYLLEDFNNTNIAKFSYDYSLVPNSKITTEPNKIIEIRSLYFESSGNFLGLIINKGLIFTPNATYKISFDYKIITFVDTVYFQFNNNGTNMHYFQFGSPSEVGVIKHLESQLTISSSSDYIIQIFPGGANGITSLVLDNIKIERNN